MMYLLWAFLKKEFYGTKHYLFNTISYIITLYVMFLFIFTGAKAFLGVNHLSSGTTIEGIIVGFMLWGSTLDVYSLLSQSILTEARLGTLEQLFMIPYGFKWVSTAMIVANLIYSFTVQGILLILMMLTTGKFLHIDLISIIPLWALTELAIYGLGFIMGGLSLIHKKVSASYQILQFLFVFLMTAPVDKHPILKLLPLGLGYNLVRRVMVNGTGIWELPLTDILILSVTSIAYLLAGYFIFTIFEKKVKNSGALSHY